MGVIDHQSGFMERALYTLKHIYGNTHILTAYEPRKSPSGVALTGEKPLLEKTGLNWDNAGNFCASPICPNDGKASDRPNLAT